MTAHNSELLTLSDVMSKLRISRASIYRRIAKGEFPQPLKIGEGTNRWPADEIDAWVRSRPRGEIGGNQDPPRHSRERPLAG